MTDQEVFQILGIIYAISVAYVFVDLLRDIFIAITKDRMNYFAAVHNNTNHVPELNVSMFIETLIIPLIPIYNTIYAIRSVSPIIYKYLKQTLTTPIGRTHEVASLKDRLRALAKTPMTGEWQPIRTCPMGLPSVLVYGCWYREDNDSVEVENADAVGVFIVTRHDADEFHVSGTQFYYPVVRNATHWMPLPEPPHCMEGD